MFFDRLFFFKQKTAYDMRISDWSSDVCSSDLKSAPALAHLPEPGVPEIAFAGRSNVGKSSLLNALTNRNGLARTSVTPGRTQELNYFDVGAPLVFRLVDMPGYRSEEHTSELQSLMRISYAVFCLKKKTTHIQHTKSPLETSNEEKLLQ